MVKGKSSLYVLVVSLWQNFLSGKVQQHEHKREIVWVCYDLLLCGLYHKYVNKSTRKKKEEQPLPISLTKCTVLWTALKPYSPYISNTKSLNNLQDFKRTRTHSQLMHMRILVPGYLSSKFTNKLLYWSGSMFESRERVRIGVRQEWGKFIQHLLFNDYIFSCRFLNIYRHQESDRLSFHPLLSFYQWLSFLSK